MRYLRFTSPYMHTARRILILFTVILVAVGCDQATKSLATTHVPTAQPLSFFADSVRLQVARNSGAFLSLGASLSARWRQGLFLFGVGTVLLLLVAYVLFYPPLPSPSVVALSLIVAGGLANLIDRFRHGGQVIDFINIGIGPVRTGIFNIADVSIFAGVALLLLYSMNRVNPK